MVLVGPLLILLVVATVYAADSTFHNQESAVRTIYARPCSQCYYCIGYFKSFQNIVEGNQELYLYKQLLCTCDIHTCSRIILRDKFIAACYKRSLSRL